MTVAAHLGIRLDEYDVRIRTFIPGYESMLEAAAQTVRSLEASPPHIVDLGTGTGALAACCLRAVPGAQVTAIDEDAGILELARGRLVDTSAGQVSTIVGSFTETAIPPCDAIVGSLTFHHVRTAEGKRQLYRRCHAALRAGGLFVTADCCPSADDRLAAMERAAWREHLLRTYSPEETDAYFSAWAQEDVYFPLAAELTLLQDAGLAADVVWRSGTFAVVAARRI